MGQVDWPVLPLAERTGDQKDADLKGLKVKVVHELVSGYVVADQAVGCRGDFLPILVAGKNNLITQAARRALRSHTALPAPGG